MNNRQQKSAKTQKEAWLYPVSRAFYEKLRAKGEQIFKDLGYGRLWTDELMKLVNAYMLRGECPQRRWTDETLLTIFVCLRHDIDQAIRRSADARCRAAERRAAKGIGKVSESSGTQTDETTVDNGPDCASPPLSESKPGSLPLCANGHQSPQIDIPVIPTDKDQHITTPTVSKVRNKRIRRNAMARRHP